ncbi:MAG: tsaB [Herminiimonas sp.]|nr:tsaB [Herminiimonas sp.]
MPTILAIETSTELASAALLHGDKVIARESSGVQTHSNAILPMVQSLLAQSCIMLAQCDAIAFGAGPGSFTGVRTACGVVQGLAFGAALPVISIVTLQAMAQACRETTGASDVLALLDARMGEVYWAQYRYANGWQTVIEPVLSAPAAVMPVGEVVACGNGLTVYAEAFGDRIFSNNAQPAVMPHAIQIAQLAETELARGHAIAPRDAQPLYLRNKVALTTMERLAKVAT